MKDRRMKTIHFPQLATFRFACLLSCLTAFCLPTSASAHDEIPGAEQKKPIALVGGTIHTVSGETISEGTLVFDKGVITQVGSDVEIPEGAETVDITGKHVYPALFEPHTHIGLTEVAAVSETIDTSEYGSYNPNALARVAVNPDSEIIPVTRSNGVLLALSAPQGGVVAGKASVMQLDGWTYEDMTLSGDCALVMSWPRMTPRMSFRNPSSPADQSRFRDSQLAEIESFFDDAEAYKIARDADPKRHPIDLKYEAMLPVLAGETAILIAANDLAEIESAVAFCVERGLKPIIFGGAEAPLCAELLNEHDVPVVIRSVYRTPIHRDSPYDAAYTLPSRLAKAGIPFCISGSDRSETWNARNLPYHAGTAVAYGLSTEDAIRSITLSPAEIFGVADKVGSLEAGKHATLFVADGDPLETLTNVEMAWIQGRTVDLDNKHKGLYRKYSEKYRRQREGE